MEAQNISLLFNIYSDQSNKDEKSKSENLKKLLNTSEIIKSEDIKPTKDLGFRLKPIVRKNIIITNEKLLNETIEIFLKYNHQIFNDENIYELKNSLLEIPFENAYNLIFEIDNKYIDTVIYHILHFIKDTKYILENREEKKRYYHSRFKIDVLKIRLEDIENIKTNVFLLPKSEYDLKLLNTKEKLLSIFEKEYNIIFAFLHMQNIMPNNSQMVKEPFFIDIVNDFTELANAISVTEKDAIKSLATLIYKIFVTKHTNFNLNEIEVLTQNILIIFFKDEIENINKEKLNSNQELDTFLVNSKEYKKYAYIHSTFDGIPVYGINKQNKYFFYKNVKQKDFMRLYFKLVKAINPQKIKLSHYKMVYNKFRNPQLLLYSRQYSEFFNSNEITPLNIMATFLSEMKKNAPDELK